MNNLFRELLVYEQLKLYLTMSTLRYLFSQTSHHHQRSAPVSNFLLMFKLLKWLDQTVSPTANLLFPSSKPIMFLATSLQR